MLMEGGAEGNSEGNDKVKRNTDKVKGKGIYVNGKNM